MSTEQYGNLPSSESAAMYERRVAMQQAYADILDSYEYHTGATIEGLERRENVTDVTRASITGTAETANKQILLTAKYGDFSFSIGGYEPITSVFTTFPELVSNRSFYTIYEQRLWDIQDRMDRRAANWYPPDIKRLRTCQYQSLYDSIGSILEGYHKAGNDDLYADEATGVYVGQENLPGSTNIFIALEHAYTLRAIGNRHQGIVRRPLVKIPAVTYIKDLKLSCFEHEWIQPEDADVILELANEAREFKCSNNDNRLFIDLKHMRRNLNY